MDNLLTNLDHRGVLTLSMDRPKVHNAFDAALIETLTKALQDAGHDPEVRIVVLTGEGSSFSAGADLNWMRSMVDASESENEQDALTLARLMRTLNYLDRPTIAMINGHTFGGGVGLVACCDITIAAESALFGLTETRLGLVPAVISPYVFRRIGEGHARRYFQSGERFDARKAREIGLLQDVVADADLSAQTGKLIDGLLEAAPGATLAARELVFALAAHDEDSQLKMDEYTARLIARLRVSAEGQEGLAAFLEKRPPDWMEPDGE